MTIAARRTFDPILLAVLANRFDGICREMTNTLLRSGRSAVLNMARDFSCALVTADNQLLASAEGLPVHVIGMEFLAEAMTDLHDDITEGDAFIHNDPYLGNTHSADHAILVPVFVDGEHVFTACAKAHQADCGNSLPTTYMPGARDIYEEGAINFPCVRIQRGYEDIQDLIRMCRRRIRVPEQWYGDYLAGLGAARIAERRLKELCGQYSVDTIKAFIEEWFDYSERRMADAIKKLPGGTLVGRTTHDPYPGLPDGIPLEVKVHIDAENGSIEIDLRDNPDNYAGGLNESRACSTNNVVTGVFNSIDPDIPHNAGSFRRVSVLLREGCIAGIPKFPHSCSMATTNVADRLVCATQAAFADIGEGFGLAEGCVGLPPAFAVVSGHDARLNEAPYVNQLFLGGGGGPGGPESDGWPTYMLPVVAALLYHDSVEVDEQKYPIHVHEQRLVTDSGGAGRRRGGLGTHVVYSPKERPMTLAYTVEGHFNPPRGVRGGEPGATPDAWKIGPDGKREELPKAAAVVLEVGERVVSVSGGGGGYGDPLDREPALVLEDVLEGAVSADAAEGSYGVVVRDRDGGLEVDAAATERRRAELRGSR
ncbi:MAG TPA: hydantoinase B/oxoprolinase family protein [Gaiellaceae bacterium]|nr:hydantoinase B/oxoprolinase family protein [Gaiellaceae bacterium]